MNMEPKPLRLAVKATLCLLFVLALMVAVAGSAKAEHWQYSRQLDCGKQPDGRAREICNSIERHLEYTFFGHAIISPGYRSTWTTVTDVWCEQRIEGKDLPVLRALAKANDWRLASAAGSLLRLLTGHDQYGTKEPENSIFNPANPSYLLKNGCPKKMKD